MRASFEALLLQPLLEPLEAAFGEEGAVVAAPFEAALAKALDR